MSEKAKPIALDATMMTSLTAVAGVAVAASLGGLAAYGWSVAMGVATGGLLATANLWLIGLVSQGVLAGGRNGKFWGLFGGLKFIALLAVAFGLLRSGLTTGLTLAAGYAALPLGVTIGTLLSQPRARSN